MQTENSFWNLPEAIKEKFKPKGKTSLNITAYKEGKFWYFNYPPITWKESLVFAKALDEISGGKDKVKMTITTYEVEGAEKVWYFQDDPLYPEASEYYWNDYKIWLCPWAVVLWSQA